MTPGRAMRFFVEERLGDPVDRALSCARSIKAQLVQEVPEASTMEARGMVVFTHPYAELEVEKAPIPVCEAKKVRGKLPKDSIKIPPEVFTRVQDKLDEIAGLTV
jgi:hypothetical protein